MTTTVTLEDDSDEPSMTVELSVTAVSVLLTIERLNLKEKKNKEKVDNEQMDRKLHLDTILF